MRGSSGWWQFTDSVWDMGKRTEYSSEYRAVFDDLIWLSKLIPDRGAFDSTNLQPRDSLRQFLSSRLNKDDLDLSSGVALQALLRVIDRQAHPFPSKPIGPARMTSAHRALAVGVLIRLYDDNEAQYPVGITDRRNSVERQFGLGNRETQEPRNFSLFAGYLRFIETQLGNDDSRNALVQDVKEELDKQQLKRHLSAPPLGTPEPEPPNSDEPEVASTAISVAPPILATPDESSPPVIAIPSSEPEPPAAPCKNRSSIGDRFIPIVFGLSILAAIATAWSALTDSVSIWPFVAIFLILLLIACLLSASESRTRVQVVSHEQLEKYAQQLAAVAADRWRVDQENRRVTDADHLIAVKCRPAASHLVDSWESIRKQAGNNEPIQLGDDLTNISAIYQQIPSGRLTIIGERGAGKSVAAAHLSLELLKSNTVGQAIPVMFPASSWSVADSEPKTVLGWLEMQLMQMFPGSEGRTSPSTTIAHDLLTQGFVLPVIDGLDELGDEPRIRLITALNTETESGVLASLRYVLTCRDSAFEEAIEKTGVLSRAVVIHVDPLPLSDALAYLVRSDPEVWQPIAERIRHNSEATTRFAATLNTPLMAFLAAATYNTAGNDAQTNPWDIMGFPTAESAREYLMDHLIPAVYWNSPHEIRLIQRWYEFLAKNTLGTMIVWWKLWDHIPLFQRVVPMTATTTAIGATGTASLYFLASASMLFVWLGIALSILAGVAIGTMEAPIVPVQIHFKNLAGWKEAAASPSMAIIGVLGYWIVKSKLDVAWWPLLISGLLAGLLPAVWVHWFRRHVPGSLSFLEEARNASLGAWGASAVIIIVGISTDSNEGSFWTWFFIGIPFSILTGLAYIPEAKMPTPVISSISMTEMLRTNMFYSFYFVVTFVLAYMFVFMPMLGWGPGIIAALVVGTVFGLFTNIWGRWIVFCRIWLPLTGKLPSDFQEFLDDACRRGVLYPDGATYKFRHELVRERLAASV